MADRSAQGRRASSARPVSLTRKIPSGAGACIARDPPAPPIALGARRDRQQADLLVIADGRRLDAADPRGLADGNLPVHRIFLQLLEDAAIGRAESNVGKSIRTVISRLAPLAAGGSSLVAR